MIEEEKSCKERIKAHYQSRMDEVRNLWNLYRENPEAYHDEYGRWDEYGLAFDYVKPGTFEGQKRGYWRYQISWGGPSDEFRFYCDENYGTTKIEYCFMDWFDGASCCVKGKNRQLWEEIWSDWLDCELPQSKKSEAEAD